MMSGAVTNHDCVVKERNVMRVVIDPAFIIIICIIIIPTSTEALKHWCCLVVVANVC